MSFACSLGAVAERFNLEGVSKALAARGSSWKSPSTTAPKPGTLFALLSYDDTALPCPLLTSNVVGDLAARAVRLGAVVLQLTAAALPPADEAALLTKLLQDVLKRPELRVRAAWTAATEWSKLRSGRALTRPGCAQDELYSLLIKQTRGCPDAARLTRGWCVPRGETRSSAPSLC